MAADFETQLLDGLLKAFNENELHDLCFRLGVDWESLPHSTKGELSRELIRYTGRNGQRNELIDNLRVLKPHYAWPDPHEGAGPTRNLTNPMQRPPAATHFTGRAPEMAELLAALQPGRMVTLYGPGGIGKTSLAAEALRELASGDDPPARFPGGVFFHTFYGRPAVADAAAEIARACGLNPSPDPFAAMRAALRGRVALLILDGAEEADDLNALLERRERCGVLITSRRREDVRDVEIEVERLPPDEALALLRAWAGARAADDAAATAVCEMVGNLPLALRLAGRYLFKSGETAAEYRDWLWATPQAALDFGGRRRESVPLLLQKSVAQVSDAARAALGVAGCLSIAPFDTAPIAAALGLDEAAARYALGELHNYQLLRRPAGRYETAHALIHAYARERLPVEPESLRRLGEYYAELAESESDKGLPGYRRLDPERGHILAVLARLAAAEGWGTANRLVWAVHSWLGIQGYQRERIAALEVGLATARVLRRRYNEGAFLAMLGVANNDIGNTMQAIDLHKHALTISHEINNRQREGQDLGNLGNAYAALGRFELAIERYEAALAISREIGDRRGEGADLGNLGIAYRNLGQVERAIEQYEAALAIAREFGDRRGEGRHLNNLGFAFLSFKEFGRALDYCHQALTISREVGDRAIEAHTLDSLGSIYHEMGDVQQATNHYEKALAIFVEIQSPQAEVTRASLAGLLE